MAETGSGSEQVNPASFPPMPDIVSLGVGHALRTRREALGWALPQVAAWLRIRESYLEAFETGQGGDFPADAYALGFLRTYAEALGFDASAVVAHYKQEGKAPVRKPVLTFPAPQPDKRIPPALTVSLGVAVIVGAYVGWYHFIGHAPPVPKYVPPVAEIIPGEKTTNAPSPQVASLLPEPGASPAPTLKPLTPPDMAPDGQQLGVPAHQVTGAESAAPAATAGMQEGTAPTARAAADMVAAEEAQLTIKAVAPSWVQVKDGTGKAVYDHIMQIGDAWVVPQENGPYTLTVGNAGGIVVAWGNMTTPPLGRNGAVRRKIMLTPDGVKDGSLAGAPVTEKTGATSAAPQSAPLAGDSAVEPNTEAKPAEPQAPPVAAHKPMAAKPDISADDLNARQLQGINQH